MSGCWWASNGVGTQIAMKSTSSIKSNRFVARSIPDRTNHGRELKRTNVFGDGTASVKIADIITGILGGNENEGK